MDAQKSLRSELRRRLLEYFFAHPDADPHVHRLARILFLDSANLAQEMVRLEQQGLLRAEFHANRKHYRLNPRSPLYRPLKDAINRSIGTIPKLETTLGRIPGVQIAWLYGPCVRMFRSICSSSAVPLPLVWRTIFGTSNAVSEGKFVSWC